MEKLLKTLTDPESNRMLQLIRGRGKMTAAEILAECGMPRATVYRKLDKMLEVGAICVAETNKVRGQFEKSYAVKDIYIANPTDGMTAATISIMHILDLFDVYFRDENADVNRDKLFIMNYALELSDKDFAEMMKEILNVADKYRDRHSDNAKLRNLYMISAPNGGKYE